MRSLIFSDIDGTLINDQHEVTPRTKEAIQKRINQGDLFIPVSARMPEAISTVADVITRQYPMIAYNGALILDEKGKIVESHTFATKLAVKIIEMVITKYPSVAWNVYSGHQWFSPKMPANLNEENIVKVISSKATISEIDELNDCHKVLLIGSPDKINNLKDEISKMYPELHVVKSSPILLEIMKKGIQKGQAVKKLVDYYQVPLDRTWAFGDNFNDQEMLQAVKHSVAMGNAPQEIKNEVEQVTTDNNHDGIADVLNLEE